MIVVSGVLSREVLKILGNRSARPLRVVVGGALALGLAYLAATIGMNYKLNRLLLELSPADSFSAALWQALHIQRWYAAGQQDMWVALAVEPGKRNGYYVDIGSADGVIHSNT